jgi:hypothetical protein
LRGHSAVELVIHVADHLIIILVSGFVETVGGVSPPSVQQASEEEGDDESGVHVGGMHDKQSTPLEGATGPGP